MDPVSIGLICAAVFGTFVVLAAFLRQIMISRDKELNDEAQSRALSQEVKELEKMRMHMQHEKRFDSHYHVLGANKDAIKYIDAKVEEVLRKKTELVERYAKVTVKESDSIVLSGEVSAERKAACDRLRKEIDQEIEFYDSELKQLQARRSTLWDTHTDFQKYLLNQEKSRNANLDNIYKQHSVLLEKVYLRHIDDREIIAVKGIEASTMTFKDVFMVPIQFLMRYFGIGTTNISLVQTRVEKDSREEVAKKQSDINNAQSEEKVDEDEEDLKNAKKKKPNHETPDDSQPHEDHSSDKEETKYSKSLV